MSEIQTITALGAWDEGHNIEVNDEFSSCPEASNFSDPIAIYKIDVLVLEKVINASTGVVIGNYEGSSKYGYFDSNLVATDYDSRITPLTVISSPLFSKNTNDDVTFPSNLTALSDDQRRDQYMHVNFLLKDPYEWLNLAQDQKEKGNLSKMSNILNQQLDKVQHTIQ